MEWNELMMDCCYVICDGLLLCVVFVMFVHVFHVCFMCFMCFMCFKNQIYYPHQVGILDCRSVAVHDVEFSSSMSSS